MSGGESPAKKAKGMQLKIVKTLWGMEEAGDSTKWDQMFASIKAKGYAGIEAISLGWRGNVDLLVDLLNKHGLALVCQIHTTGGDLVEGNYIYQASSKLEDHKQSFSALVEESKHVEFCHCRCGWAQGPQIPDPTAPEYSSELALHMEWWVALWTAQLARGNAECWIEPEYGPPPYLVCLPHSGKPVADLETVVEAAKKQLEEAYKREIEAAL